ncbi:MAG: hypothetical protein HPY65_07105 [Syntrophaceae bacterium]|nr:hypothetical protein [Syntrophaceae bacterium]
MKKVLAVLMLLSWVMLMPSPAMAEVDVKVRINIPLPPPIVFPAVPEVVVIPETYVYAVPDVREEIFFYNGWWWRPWEGRWYRSRNYDRGWAYYERTPGFYKRVPPGWRNDYHSRRWKGHEWDQRRIPYRDMETNWRGWQRGKHWERENYWGVRGQQPRKQGPMRGQPQQYRDDRQGPPAKAQEAGPQSKQVKKKQERRDRDLDDDRGRGRGRGRGPQKDDRDRDRDDDRGRDRDGRR